MNTIASAIRTIKSLKSNLSNNSQRLTACVNYNEENPPAWDFDLLLEERKILQEKLIKFETAVAVANANTKLEYNGNKQSLCFWIKKLAEIKSDIATLSLLYSNPLDKTINKTPVNKYHPSTGQLYTETVEIVHICRLPQAKKANLIDQMQKEFDELNILVERTNHKTLIKDL